MPSYIHLANLKTAKKYSPFLLESAATVWRMDVFNEYLKVKQFILRTDHIPLEKMGHLHTKTMNRLQAALLEHDFVPREYSVQAKDLFLSISNGKLASLLNVVGAGQVE
jgi:hypothetical protein